MREVVLDRNVYLSIVLTMKLFNHQESSHDQCLNKLIQSNIQSRMSNANKAYKEIDNCWNLQILKK